MAKEYRSFHRFGFENPDSALAHRVAEEQRCPRTLAEYRVVFSDDSLARDEAGRAGRPPEPERLGTHARIERRLLGEGDPQFAALLTKISAVLPAPQQDQAGEITGLVFLTLIARAALTRWESADAEATIRQLGSETERANANARQWRTRATGAFDPRLHQAELDYLRARMARDQAVEDVNLARTGLANVQTKEVVAATEAFKPQLVIDLISPPFRCSVATVARLLVAAGLEPAGEEVAPYPDRPPLVERIRKRITRPPRTAS